MVPPQLTHAQPHLLGSLQTWKRLDFDETAEYNVELNYQTQIQDSYNYSTSFVEVPINLGGNF